MSVSLRRASSAAFFCSGCGTESPKWQGRCGGCGDWNTLVEAPTETALGRRTPRAPGAARPRLLGAVVDGALVHHSSGQAELDRVTGGGIVDGGLILLGGDPGIGKSTLALQVANHVGSAERHALYCAGEESPGQLAMRARRLDCAPDHIDALAETDLDACIATITETRPALAVVDSVQTVEVAGATGHPGSPTQVRAAVARLMACAKSTGVPILLVGHVTKEGAIAGPRTLEHMVDVVLFLEGERHSDHRLLRGIKNRFGTTGELGVFRMSEAGMESVEAASRAFLDDASLGVPGNVLTVTCEGTRALVVEIQALTVSSSNPAMPRRTATGFDLGRLHLLLAVLQRRGRVLVGGRDVFLNCVGGVRLSEPAVDLAAALAIVGVVTNRQPPRGCVVIGEIGLGGEIRRVRRMEARLSEAQALGLTRAIVPAGYRGELPEGMVSNSARTLTEAIELLA
ncbi:MAG: DNA repair protein RadA [Candidatus Dormibacteria bacterium]